MTGTGAHRSRLAMPFGRMLCVFAAFSGLGGSSAAAQTLSVEPDELRVVARITPGTSSFTRALRITARGADVEELGLLTRGLFLEDDSSVVVLPSDVDIPAGISLVQGIPRQVPVTIANVPRPGTYGGQLELTTGSVGGRPYTIEVSAEISEAPRVTSTREVRTVDVVHCSRLCLLADLLVPGRVEQGDSVQFLLANETRVPVAVDTVRYDLLGANTNATLGEWALSFDTTAVLPASGMGSVAMTLRPDRIEADTYQGDLRFRMEGGETAVRMGFTLNVRSGPGLALLALLLGIVAARLRKEKGDQSLDEEEKKQKLAPRFFSSALGIVTGRRPRTKEEWLKQAGFALVVVGLVIVGLTTLYVSDASFGAKGLADYFSLFLWGFGADVTQLSFNK